MIRKSFAALGLAALFVAGLAAPAQATERTPCVKVINGVEIRTCAIIAPPRYGKVPGSLARWLAYRAR